MAQLKSGSTVGGELIVTQAGIVDHYSKGNILGTVSQTSGVPTGAVIERGSNANGEYVKFADGTLIILMRKSIANCEANEVKRETFTLPASILPAWSASPAPVFIIDSSGVGDDHYGVTYGQIKSNTTVDVTIRNGATPQNFTLAGLVVGRWF